MFRYTQPVDAGAKNSGKPIAKIVSTGQFSLSQTEYCSALTPVDQTGKGTGTEKYNPAAPDDLLPVALWPSVMGR